MRIRHSSTGKAYHSIGTDEINGPLHDQAVGVVKFPNFLPAVDQQWEWETVFPPEFAVVPGALRIHAEDLDAALLGFLPIVAELAQLLGAAGSIVTGIEDQHHVAAA